MAPASACGVPLLDGPDGGVVADQHRVYPFAQQPFREVGVVGAGAQEIAERTQHTAVEPVARGEQRGRARRQAHAVALEFLQRLVPRRQLGDRLLGPAPIGAGKGLVFPRLGQQVPCALGIGCRRRGGPPAGGPLLPPACRAAAPSTANFLAEPVAERGRLDRAVPQRRQVGFERRPLALERAEGLRLALERLFHLAHLRALLGQARLDGVFDARAPLQLALDPVVVRLRRVALLERDIALPERLLGALLHQRAFLERTHAALARRSRAARRRG